MNVYTIGFTKKSAETFFGLIRSSRIRTLIDVRLNNASQLAGFAKKGDLTFFLREICSAEYVHIPDLTPTRELLDPYRKGDMTWAAYQHKFLDLMAQRNVERAISLRLLDQGCLLCSEHEPHMCHRRLVAEYLNEASGLDLTIRHLY